MYELYAPRIHKVECVLHYLKSQKTKAKDEAVKLLFSKHANSGNRMLHSDIASVS